MNSYYGVLCINSSPSSHTLEEHAKWFCFHSTGNGMFSTFQQHKVMKKTPLATTAVFEGQKRLCSPTPSEAIMLICCKNLCRFAQEVRLLICYYYYSFVMLPLKFCGLHTY